MSTHTRISTPTRKNIPASSRSHLIPALLIASLALLPHLHAHSQLIEDNTKTHHTPYIPLLPESSELTEPLPSGWEFSLQLGYSSRYISEGIDVFGSGGIWELAPELRYKDLSLLVWYGLSDRLKNTEELKFITSYEFRPFAQWVLTPSFEHCIGRPDHVITDTAALTLCYEATSWMIWGVDAQYDVTDKPRGYYDAFCECNFEISERTQATLCLLYAWNDGYLGDGFHRGSNTLNYSLTLETKLTENLSQIAVIQYGQALTALRHTPRTDDGKTYGNVWSCGLYLRYSF